MRFTESDFFYLQQQADSRWGLAFIVALALHLGFGLSLYWMPSLFSTTPLVEEVVSVSLVTLAEAGGDRPRPAVTRPAEPTLAPTPKPVPKPKPAVEPAPVVPAPAETVAIKTDPVPSVPPAPVVTAPTEPTLPVSLTPTKRKVKKTQDTRLVEEKRAQRQREEQALQEKIAERQKIVEDRRREAEAQKKAEEKRLAEEKRKRERERVRALARQEQLQAEKEARAAAAEARQLAQELARIDSENTALDQAIEETGSGGRATARSIVGENYVSSVLARIKGVWKLPNTRLWDNQLYANVVITINRQGQLVEIRFDRHSGDPQFDQVVEKTIHQAAPMPPFPALMQGDTVDVGGNFNTRELNQMR
nr:cell envelope integrity protein TolA [uncultured Desulfobulbus sp.]